MVKDFIYLFMRHTEKEAKTQAEGEAGSLQGLQRGTRSWDPGIMTRAKGRSDAQLLSHLGVPLKLF